MSNASDNNSTTGGANIIIRSGNDNLTVATVEGAGPAGETIVTITDNDTEQQAVVLTGGSNISVTQDATTKEWTIANTCPCPVGGTEGCDYPTNPADGAYHLNGGGQGCLEQWDAETSNWLRVIVPVGTVFTTTVNGNLQEWYANGSCNWTNVSQNNVLTVNSNMPVDGDINWCDLTPPPAAAMPSEVFFSVCVNGNGYNITKESLLRVQSSTDAPLDTDEPTNGPFFIQVDNGVRTIWWWDGDSWEIVGSNQVGVVTAGLITGTGTAADPIVLDLCAAPLATVAQQRSADKYRIMCLNNTILREPERTLVASGAVDFGDFDAGNGNATTTAGKAAYFRHNGKLYIDTGVSCVPRGDNGSPDNPRSYLAVVNDTSTVTGPVAQDWWWFHNTSVVCLTHFNVPSTLYICVETEGTFGSVPNNVWDFDWELYEVTI